MEFEWRLSVFEDENKFENAILVFMFDSFLEIEDIINKLDEGRKLKKLFKYTISKTVKSR